MPILGVMELGGRANAEYVTAIKVASPSIARR